MKKVTLIICACLLTFSMHAQSFVTINNDPVTTAMGETEVSSAASAFSIYNNTASTSLTTDICAVAYSYSPYMWNFSSGNHLHTIAGYYKLGSNHTLATGLRYFNKTNIMLINEEGEDERVAKPKDLSVEVGYAYRLNETMGVAANVRLIHSNMDVSDMKGTSVGFDIGYYIRREKLTLGVVLSNVGSQIAYGVNKYDTPTWLKVGGSYEWIMSDKHRLTGSVQCDYHFQPDSEKGFSSGIGAEYSYNRFLYLRGGYCFTNDLKGYNQATMGIGGLIGFTKLNLAYVIAEDGPLDKTMLMSVEFYF
ncbi:MAG: PorV/PorQ family protein [Mangrovibacterium sp.]